jgi:hypothetical protein
MGCKQEAGASGPFTVSGTWRYKMTVTVETPDGDKIGYAVRELSNSASNIKIIDLPQSTNSAKVKGEAVVVDLGKRGKLFALLKGYKGNHNHASQIIYKLFGGGTNVEGIKKLNSLANEKAILQIADYPMLVTFKDINDPKTVALVMDIERDKKDNTAQPRYLIKADNFEELFGKGVKLKEITIEMTDEPVTSSIDGILPWLSSRMSKAGYLGGDPSELFKDSTKTYLTGTEFIKRDSK